MVSILLLSSITPLLYLTAYYTSIMDYEEVARLMEEHGIDKDTAEKAQELIEEQGLDEDDAIELADEL